MVIQSNTFYYGNIIRLLAEHCAEGPRHDVGRGVRGPLRKEPKIVMETVKKDPKIEMAYLTFSFLHLGLRFLQKGGPKTPKTHAVLSKTV